MVKAKYQDVLNLGEALNIQNGDVSEENGVLKIKGTANTPSSVYFFSHNKLLFTIFNSHFS